VTTSLVPIQLSNAQMVNIARYAHEHGVQQHSWEALAEFVSRVLRELESHPGLARQITINVFNIMSSALGPQQPSGLTAGRAALWAARIGLLAFGIYTIF
jgi:hypothetical protein